MLRKPAWPYKLRLAPHHFQRADEHHEQSAIRALSRVAEDAWGVNEIDWDVSQGKLEIRQLEITLEDGTEVYVESGDRPLTLPMPDLGPRESMRIFIGIPAAQSGRANANGTGDPHDQGRYAIETHSIPDLANGTKAIEAQWLRPNAWLLTEASALNRFDVVQCARLIRDDNGNPILDPTYVPPIWRIRASTYLTEELEQLLELLRSRKTWADHWHALDALKDRRRQLRGLLGTFVQRILDLLDRPATRPHKAYLDLVDMLHALAPFTPEGDAPLPALASENGRDDAALSLPPFNHQDLGRTFSALFAALGRTLNAIGAEEHQEIRLDVVSGFPWARQADLSKAGLFHKDFFLAVTGDDVDRLRVEVERLVKIAPLRDLIEMKYAHLAGVPVHWRQRPAKLPETKGALYFQLDKRSEVWTAISRAAWMGIQCPIAGISSIALYAVNPDAS